jgi:uncharacterized protein (UPF0264 family)
MQLLVSVRSAAEAGIALSGGADIVDAKEPSRGSLGTVSPGVLHEICERIPCDRPVSIALGDLRTATLVREAISHVPQSVRPVTYLKLGFAGIARPEVVGQLLQAAVDKVAGSPVAVVAVAYADAANAGALPPEVLCRIAGEIGVAGVLLDTHHKGAGDLLSWLEPSRLAELLAKARAAGLLTAVAGGLGAHHLSTVREMPADIVGFRGAVCAGGREGQLSEHRVKQIRRQLASNSGFVHPLLRPHPQVGETPVVSANLDRRT